MHLFVWTCLFLPVLTHSACYDTWLALILSLYTFVWMYLPVHACCCSFSSAFLSHLCVYLVLFIISFFCFYFPLCTLTPDTVRMHKKVRIYGSTTTSTLYHTTLHRIPCSIAPGSYRPSCGTEGGTELFQRRL